MSWLNWLAGRTSSARPQRSQRTQKRSGLSVEALENRLNPSAQPVLMVLPNQDFYYKDYADTRVGIERAGISVEVAAAQQTLARPHAFSGQGADGGFVMPDLTLAQADADRYSAIVFVGGWGASSYQYAFSGTYHNSAYRGDAATKDAVNNLIGDFVDQDKIVAGICYGVTALAWARVDGQSPLEGRSVAGYWGGAPGSTIADAASTNWQIAANGAEHLRSGSVGDTKSWHDDVVVDGRIITAEDFRSALRFGDVVAENVLTLTPPAPVAMPTVRIVANTASVTENGGVPLSFTVSRDAVAPLDQDLTVNYTTSGSASASDYASLSGSVVIPAGQTAAVVTVVPTNDTLVEGGENLILTLAAAPTYQLSAANSVTGEIIDEDRLPVLLVIANQDFYYQEYADSRRGIEERGLSVQVAAATLATCVPHANSGQGAAAGFVTPDIALAQADAANYSAIVFVGGWGSSSYQYAFEGTYANAAYNGDAVTRAHVNDLINDFVEQDKFVAAVCHGVSVLAYARVDGVSLLDGRTVSAYGLASPNRTDAGTYSDTTRWHVESNGATMVASRSVGDPNTATDDVIVDGKIITAENWDSALAFGRTVADQVKL